MEAVRTPDSSRPPSRAQSEATERPDSPTGTRTAAGERSVATEIEHIKSLISRISGVARPTESTITAQVFRKRTGSAGPVSQARIIHELDLLKKRIRNEQHHVRRPSQIDPETEDESEDSLDERDEELENIRGELLQEREQSEQLLTSAEARVDILTSEKEELAEQLNTNKKELAETSFARDDLRQALRGAEGSIKELRRQMEEIRESLTSTQQENEQLRSSHQQTQSSLDALQVEKDGLEKANADHDVRKSELLEEIERQKKLAEDGQRDIELHGKEMSQLLGDHESLKTQVEDLTKERDGHVSQLMQLRGEHESVKSQVEDLKKERDEHKTNVETLQAEKGQDSEKAERQLQDLQSEHDSLIKTLNEKQDAQHNRLQEELQAAKIEHGKQLETLQSEHGKQIQAIRVAAAEAKRQAEDAEGKSTSNMEDLTTRLTIEQQENQSLRDQLQTKEDLHQDQVKSAETRLAEMEQHVAESDQRVTEAEASRKAKEAELDVAIAAKDNEIADVHGQLSELQQKLYDQTAELQGKNAELSQAVEVAHRDLSEANQSHERGLTELKDQHAQDLAGLENSHTATLDSTRLEAENSAEKARQSHAEMMSNMKKEHERALQMTKDESQSQAEQLKNGHADEVKLLHGQIQALKDEHEAATKVQEDNLRDTSEKHEAVLLSLRTDLANAKEAQSDNNRQRDEEVFRLKEEHERDMAEFEKGWSSKADEAAASHQAELSRAQGDFQKSLAELTSESDRRTSGLNDHIKELATITENLTTQLENALSDVESRKAELVSAKAEHERSLAQMQETHDRLIEDHKAQKGVLEQTHQDTLSNLDSDKSELQRQITDIKARNEEALENAKVEKSSLQTQLDELKSQHEASLQSLNSERDTASAEQQSIIDELKESIAQLRRDHDSELEQVRNDHESHTRELETKAADEMTKVRGQHTQAFEAATVEHRDSLNQALSDHEESKRSLQDQLQKVADESRAKLADLESQHSKALENVEASRQKDLQDSQENREQAVRDLRQSHSDELKSAQDSHEQAIQDLRQGHSNELQSTQEGYERAIQDLRQGHSGELQSTQEAHERAVQELRQSHQSELQTTQDTHQRKLDELGSSLKAQMEYELASQSSADEARHQESLDKAISEARESSRSEIAALRKSHKKEVSRVQTEAEKDMAKALGNADEDLDERLKARSKAHRKELDKVNESRNTELSRLQAQLEESSRLRETQMKDAETQHRSALDEVGQKLQAAEATSTALQARLDAELTGRAEAERSLATYKKNRFEEDRVHSENKESLHQRITTLEAEKADVERRLDAITASPKPDQAEESRELPDIQNDAESVTLLKERFASAEKERDDAYASVQKELDEIARQNEFLVKELETIMAQRSAEKAPAKSLSEASVQTEPVTVLDESSDRQILDEKKVDMATSKAIKTERRNSQLLAEAGAANAQKGRSFEEYLHHAQTELSELGNVISANEALFAQKIQEHIGDLQSAKDRLANEYKQKYDALQSDKERMERDASAKSAAEFAQQRKELVASYGISPDDPAKQSVSLTKLPTLAKRALRHAEEKLVSEYNRRIVKRKSQIAMKHADEFQALTQDYDRRIAQLLNEKGKLEGNLSIPAQKFEEDWDALGVESTQLQKEKVGSLQSSPEAARSGADLSQRAEVENALRAAADTAPRPQVAKQKSTSVPRTPTSIPRAVPFPGNRDGLDAPRSPRRLRPLSEIQLWPEDRSLAQRQQAHLRSNTRTDVSLPPLPKSAPTTPRTPPGPILAKRNASRDLRSSAAEFVEQRPPTGDKSERPPTGDKPQSPPDAATRPTSRFRSLRHSSRIIYGFQNARDS